MPDLAPRIPWDDATTTVLSVAIVVLATAAIAVISVAIARRRRRGDTGAYPRPVRRAVLCLVLLVVATPTLLERCRYEYTPDAGFPWLSPQRAPAASPPRADSPTPPDPADLDLEYARFNGRDLTHTRLADGRLYRADLREADLTGVDLSRARLDEAALGRASMRAATLADASLVDADLAGADLTNADLTRADLTRARLDGANLTGADLTDADLTGASLVDVVGLTPRQIGTVRAGTAPIELPSTARVDEACPPTPTPTPAPTPTLCDDGSPPRCDTASPVACPAVHLPNDGRTARDVLLDAIAEFNRGDTRYFDHWVQPARCFHGRQHDEPGADTRVRVRTLRSTMVVRWMRSIEGPPFVDHDPDTAWFALVFDYYSLTGNLRIADVRNVYRLSRADAEAPWQIDLEVEHDDDTCRLEGEPTADRFASWLRTLDWPDATGAPQRMIRRAFAPPSSLFGDDKSASYAVWLDSACTHTSARSLADLTHLPDDVSLPVRIVQARGLSPAGSPGGCDYHLVLGPTTEAEAEAAAERVRAAHLPTRRPDALVTDVDTWCHRPAALTLPSLPTYHVCAVPPQTPGPFGDPDDKP